MVHRIVGIVSVAVEKREGADHSTSFVDDDHLERRGTGDDLLASVCTMVKQVPFRGADLATGRRSARTSQLLPDEGPRTLTLGERGRPNQSATSERLTEGRATV